MDGSVALRLSTKFFPENYSSAATYKVRKVNESNNHFEAGPFLILRGMEKTRCVCETQMPPIMVNCACVLSVYEQIVIG